MLFLDFPSKVINIVDAIYAINIFRFIYLPIFYFTADYDGDWLDRKVNRNWFPWSIVG